ncbi:MAG TPA: hypothetical protein VE994_11575 [Terriglobales bacterium]|nr:hypothetical protein [Terriglobales bacterium]
MRRQSIVADYHATHYGQSALNQRRMSGPCRGPGVDGIGFV